jgi:lysozyme
VKLVIDISHWETVTDFQKVKDAGVSGVYLKATEGKGGVDLTFESYRKGCEKVGLPWGAYHFWRPEYTASNQADHFLTILNDNHGQLPPVMDCEPYPTKPDRMSYLAAIQQFMKIIDLATKKPTMLYTNPDNIHYLKPIPDWLKAHPLWLAHYYNVPDYEPWVTWTMWQYTDAGKINGIYDAVDMNKAQDGLFNELPNTPVFSDAEKIEKLWSGHPELWIK